MMRSLYTKHETFAVFLSDPLDGLGRWQLWICLMSLIITQLMVQARGLRYKAQQRSSESDTCNARIRRFGCAHACCA